MGNYTSKDEHLEEQTQDSIPAARPRQPQFDEARFSQPTRIDTMELAPSADVDPEGF